MSRLFSLVFIILFVLVTTGVQIALVSVVQGSITCNVTDETSSTWCKDQFDKGGNVTATDWQNTSFVCACNSVLNLPITISSNNTSSTPMCSWTGSFDPNLPSPDTCNKYSGVCPTTCANLSNICDTSTSWCTDTETGYNYTCAMCSGVTYTILYNGTSCTHSTASTFECNIGSTCNGNGCCAVPSSSTKQCNCYADNVHGYWDGLHCSSCLAGYTVNDQGVCLVAKPTIEIILSSIAKTWTMVLPNLMVIVLFVVCGIARRPWESERTFPLTMLRRTNLSVVQLERRGRQSLFHPKKMPKRPLQSRSFANPALSPENYLQAY